MKKENGISEELKSIGSRLADFSREMPYSVPEGFFADFGDNIGETIRELNEPDTVTGWSRELPFTIPNGYFEALIGNISAAIAADVVAGLPKGLPQHVPAGYFEKLPAQMLLAAKAGDTVKKETKIIPLKPRRMNPVRWAAAAVVLMCIGLGSYETFYSSPNTNPDKLLASVSNNDIQSYLQGTYRVDVDRITGNTDVSNLQVDNKDIVDYLNETGWDATE